MKFALCVIAYLAAAITLVTVGIAGASILFSPGEEISMANANTAAKRAPVKLTSTQSAVAKSMSVTAVEPAKISAPKSTDVVAAADRAPAWIAATTKYPASAHAVNAAPRAKQRAQVAASDWRLKERRRRLDEALTANSYAPVAKVAVGPAYEEPMQFRERGEPR